MELKHETAGEKLTVQFSGEMDLSEINEIENYVSGLIKGKNEIIFDFDNVYYIDSAGLNYLLKMDVRIREAGGIFSVENIFGNVKRIFEISGVINQLTASSATDIGGH